MAKIEAGYAAARSGAVRPWSHGSRRRRYDAAARGGKRPAATAGPVFGFSALHQGRRSAAASDPGQSDGQCGEVHRAWRRDHPAGPARTTGASVDGGRGYRHRHQARGPKTPVPAFRAIGASRAHGRAPAWGWSSRASSWNSWAAQSAWRAPLARAPSSGSSCRWNWRRRRTIGATGGAEAGEVCGLAARTAGFPHPHRRGPARKPVAADEADGGHRHRHQASGERRAMRDHVPGLAAAPHLDGPAHAGDGRRRRLPGRSASFPAAGR